MRDCLHSASWTPPSARPIWPGKFCPTTARAGTAVTACLITQFRQSVFGRIAGYEDVNDAMVAGDNPREAREDRREGDRPCRYSVFPMAEFAVPTEPFRRISGEDRSPPAKAGCAMLAPPALHRHRDNRIASTAMPKPAKARCRILAARLPWDSDPGCAQNSFHYTKD